MEARRNQCEFDRMEEKRQAGGQLVNAVVFDLETTGLRPEKDEIIEIGAVRMENGQIVETFHSLIQPKHAVSDDILKLTGISTVELAKSSSLEEVMPRFLAFISGYTLAGHNVSFDLGFLKEACDTLGYVLPTSADALDTYAIARILKPTAPALTLIDLARILDVPMNGAHRALADATTTASVLIALEQQADALPYVTLQLLTRLAGMYTPTGAAWFNEAAERRFGTNGATLSDRVDVIQQLAFSSPTSAKNDGTETIAAVEPFSNPADLVSANSPLQQILPGFQARSGQRQMVEAVTAAFEGDEHLLVEAGTGTGKSLAYLIPAALYARANDTRVVVSTHTIALQDQIEQRDFPTLRKLIGEPLSLSVFKGRTHYVCMRKLLQEVQNVSFATPREEIESYMSLLVWLLGTTHGNREELPLQGASAEVWPRIQSETETCIHKRCPFFKPCYYFRARGAAFEADVVVTNHSLVFSDLKAEHRVLPKYDKLVFDEAHHLEDQATKHLGEEVHQWRTMARIARLVRDAGKHGVLPELARKVDERRGPDSPLVRTLHVLEEHIANLRQVFDGAFHALSQLLPGISSEIRVTAAVVDKPAWQDFLQYTVHMMQSKDEIDKQRSILDDYAEQEQDNELAGRMFDASGFLTELMGQLLVMCQATDTAEEWVVWVEKSGPSTRPQISVHRAPIDVAHILNDMLFSKKSSIILTSATLSVEGKFDYTKALLGLSEADADGRLESVIVPSPFQLQKQTLLCVPNDVPELAKLSPDEAATWLSDSIYQLAKASGGRLLALFTSHAMLRATATRLQAPLAESGLRLFAQGIDGSRSRLLSAFRQHENGVLLGAQSFWEGIDLPGNELTTLVIVRLPFAPPTHPVTEARNERMERSGKSPFTHRSLPEAVVRFRQGFGRLIRTVEDRGVVVVYDKRLVTARYGQSFIKSLEGVRPYVATEADVLNRVRTFFANA